MKFDKIYLKSDSEFSNYLAEWAGALGVQSEEYDLKMEEHLADGLLLINENQDVDKDNDELHTLFDKKHLPTQKIDLNGTLQVAISNFKMWMQNNKCKNVLVLGADDLVNNEKLGRFLERIKA